MKKTTLNPRVLVVFLMMFTAPILLFSGVTLHSADANQAERLKFISMALHNVTALVCLIAAIVHMKYNWKPILNYVRNKKDGLLKYPKELGAAGIMTAILSLLAVSHVLRHH
ncbi:hypothetical protein [Persicirhabdus sediminis]|uniref:DUF4405 domain-containing protein n=1 Tax=Persicirhabdus sediminis TaxID=454144 RepID=A0A8J7SGB9_9BACT|nr:hypothetical protein [Persicirhabdus sediminis]MBK1790020.1 hypothetical protein [Persicirhabdus sediminis]